MWQGSSGRFWMIDRVNYLVVDMVSTDGIIMIDRVPTKIGMIHRVSAGLVVRKDCHID